MPSGITHMLLAREYSDFVQNNNLNETIGIGLHYFEVGAVAPDLPYASIIDSDILESETELADDCHYKKTNLIPLTGFKHCKKLQASENKDHMFSFFLGYSSHVFADGIIHPFVRDMVGDYEQNKDDHRILEMRLDVILMNHFTKDSGDHVEFNKSNLHHVLKTIKNYSNLDEILEIYDGAIETVYGRSYGLEKIKGWISALHRLFDLAEGEHDWWYKNLPLIDNYLYQNYSDLVRQKEKFIILEEPIDGLEFNFLKKPRINLIEDAIPQFLNKFDLFAQRAYDYVYDNGVELNEEDIPLINLDTGRLAENNNLSIIPVLWS